MKPTAIGGTGVVGRVTTAGGIDITTQVKNREMGLFPSRFHAAKRREPDSSRVLLSDDQAADHGTANQDRSHDGKDSPVSLHGGTSKYLRGGSPGDEVAGGGTGGDGIEEGGPDGCADLLAGGDHRRTNSRVGIGESGCRRCPRRRDRKAETSTAMTQPGQKCGDVAPVGV